ncbi:uncharacterized protein TRIVIDRAFT_68209 [Trichoderma virens Gv29-8]|uniref:Uncharacterized protein n=1 Tax=Hypocrea virens (strain Gv29-8 / FGSC 10586) TaxID=413071 RepID=G9N0B2_HYPVG|nr:uncharacterized protein TRIVIDRAFT_68209 [Trichoderma virens Gv29-8]EHK19794.1 hypothetical protein TRIVIDRAFT_68209 [Trichoderma virens Gv29-8]
MSVIEKRRISTDTQFYRQKTHVQGANLKLGIPPAMSQKRPDTQQEKRKKKKVQTVTQCLYEMEKKAGSSLSMHFFPRLANNFSFSPPRLMARRPSQSHPSQGEDDDDEEEKSKGEEGGGSGRHKSMLPPAILLAIPRIVALSRLICSGVDLQGHGQWRQRVSRNRDALSRDEKPVGRFADRWIGYCSGWPRKAASQNVRWKPRQAKRPLCTSTVASHFISRRTLVVPLESRNEEAMEACTCSLGDATPPGLLAPDNKSPGIDYEQAAKRHGESASREGPRLGDTVEFCTRPSLCRGQMVTLWLAKLDSSAPSAGILQLGSLCASRYRTGALAASPGRCRLSVIVTDRRD